MKKIHLLCMMLAVLFLSAFRSDRVITVYMIGDSTMANKSLDAGNQERGWGHVLGGYFTEDVRVENHAVNGRSSKSFIDEGRWDAVVNKIRPGDYVFIQFGHNDEKADPKRHTDPGTTFDENLRKFVRETRAKGGIPVLFNSIVRRNFGANPQAVAADDVRSEQSDDIVEGDTLVDTHGKYLDSPRNVAREMGVTFIDLNKATKDLVESMGVEGSKELFMWIPKGVSPACPKGRQDNTHLNVYGARKVAKLAVQAIEKQIPELGKYVRYYDFVVAKDGSGDFFTVQEAINAVPDFRKNKRTTILVRKGEYKERVIIPECKINVSLIGEEGAVITDDNYASKKNIFGDEMSTSGSSTVYIYAPDFYAEHITFANTAGRVGQAVACFIDGDRAYFKNCRFLGNQDTLYTYGKESRQYYEGCYIEGTVDFIFGWSTAVFKDCEIHSLGDGYVTAPSTDQGKAYGYVFWNCRLTAADEAGKVYLSRPWRPYAQAVYIQCEMGKHIVPEGWNNWGKASNEQTVYYAEYQSTGEGANPSARVKYSHQLADISKYQPEQVLAGNDGWNPIKNGNALLTNVKR
ncbi:pectinesterase family protein [Bacteroides gallinaceum]|uniref:pectinesterase family protein n=1 Tax=Bacteroides gallinaceum TaxID=1462571 RepID=UPI0025A3CB7B|nr:pectinesterase family protein [Bacteroides gallinaceum]MDM8155051.1 pectinesterase family protein [Bacteroides gallinaceum]